MGVITDGSSPKNLICDCCPVAIVIMDAQTRRIVDCNPAAARLFGYPSERDVIGKDVIDLSAPVQYDGTAAQDVIEANIARALHDGPVVFEWRHLRPDNQEWDGEIQLQSYDINKPTMLMYTVKEITERVRFEATRDALAESEAKYRTLFDTMTQGVIYQDAQGRIIDANPAAQEILGITLDQMRGLTSMDPHWKSIREDGTDFPGEEHPIPVALRTGREVRNVIHGVFNPQRNAVVWLSVNAIPLFRPGESAPWQAYATIEDITGRVEAEDWCLPMNAGSRS